MNPMQDHFLEVFERRRRGDASRAELAELEAHAGVCSSCARELSLMDAFARERQPSSSDFFADERAVATALRQLEAGRPARKRAGWRLASAALLVAGAAAATGGVWRLASVPPAPEPAPVGVSPAAPATPHPAADSKPSEPLTAAVEAAAPTPPSPSAGSEPTKPLDQQEPAQNAAQLFSKANQLRRQGQDTQATDVYRELERRFPSSAEAQQSSLTLGWLLLDRSRPSEALQQFERYLSHGGPGSEDALAGKALAQQRLGRSADERTTLSTLVARYPTSAHAARAKKRLAELP